MVTLVDEEDEHPDVSPGRIDSSWGASYPNTRQTPPTSSLPYFATHHTWHLLNSLSRTYLTSCSQSVSCCWNVSSMRTGIFVQLTDDPSF